MWKPYLREWVRLNLWELVFHVVGIHRLDLVSRWCTKNLDDLHQLVDPALSREKGLTQHQLRHNAPCRPNVYKNAIMSELNVVYLDQNH